MLTNENLTRMEGDEVSQYLASLSSPLLPSILTEPLATKGTRRGALVRARGTVILHRMNRIAEPLLNLWIYFTFFKYLVDSVVFEGRARRENDPEGSWVHNC